MKTLAVLSAFFTLAASAALAQDPPPPPPPPPVSPPAEEFVVPFVPTIRCELLVARLPVARAIALQKELRDVQTIGKGIEKLLALIEKNQAELVDWPVLTTRAGSRAATENVREVRFPIEFELPQAVFPNMPNPDGQDVAAPSATEPPKPAAPPADGSDHLPTKVKLKRPSDKPEATLAGAGPTTFATSNVGVTFEIDPRIADDGETLDIHVAPQHKSLLGYRREVFEVEGHYKLVIQQPLFDVQKTATYTTLKSGQSQLIGFYKVQEPKDTVELHILTVTILDKPPTAPPASKPSPTPPAQ